MHCWANRGTFTLMFFKCQWWLNPEQVTGSPVQTAEQEVFLGKANLSFLQYTINVEVIIKNKGLTEDWL